MRFDILTLFPDMLAGYLQHSILKRAQDTDHLSIGIHNIRDWATDKHQVTDEPPYGGGGGMVLKPDPIFAAVESIQTELDSDAPVILMTPQGRPFTQSLAAELSKYPNLILVCGRYEGFDERIREHLATDEISVGDYVLTGGELPALIVVDAVTRLLPDVLGADGAAENDSHATGLLEGAHYTRPETFREWSVPDVLRSGHAAKIARWRRDSSLRRTWERRPEMLLTAELDEADRRFLAVLARETIRTV